MKYVEIHVSFTKALIKILIFLFSKNYTKIMVNKESEKKLVVKIRELNIEHVIFVEN